MKYEGFNHGFSDDEWQRAKDEARSIMVERAKVRGMISYSELVDGISEIRLEAHDPRLFNLLAEISTEEDSEGRGMLTALVVHKQGDMEPGTGFYDLAERLGRDVGDIDECWINELHKVHAVWSD